MNTDVCADWDNDGDTTGLCTKHDVVQRHPCTCYGCMHPTCEVVVQITPSSLSDIHAFLVTHHAAPPPWSSPRARLDALLALLQENRDNDGFWLSLSQLLRRLEDRRISPALIDGNEALDGASLEDVLTALRQVLHTPSSMGLSVFRQLRPLVGFAVLGIALFGCGDKSEQDCDEADGLGLSEDATSVYCALLTLINESDGTDADKNDLIDCLPDLSDARRAELLAEFETASDQELADLIASMASGSECFEDDETWGTH